MGITAVVLTVNGCGDEGDDMTEFHPHAAFVLDLAKEVAWAESRILTGYTVTFKEHTTLIILKAKRKGERQVCFVEAETHLEAWRVVYALMYNKGGLSWKADRYAKK